MTQEKFVEIADGIFAQMKALPDGMSSVTILIVKDDDDPIRMHAASCVNGHGKLLLAGTTKMATNDHVLRNLLNLVNENRGKAFMKSMSEAMYGEKPEPPVDLSDIEIGPDGTIINKKN